MNIVFIGIDIFVLFIFIICVLSGIINGLPKMFITKGIKWTLIIGFIIFSFPITKILYNNYFPYKAQLISYIEELIKIEIVEGSYIYSMVTNIIISVCRIIIIFGGITLITILIYPIVALILKIIGIRRLFVGTPGAEKGKSFVSRILGGGFGVLVFFAIFMIFIAPTLGSLELANNIYSDYKNISEQSKLETINKDLSFNYNSLLTVNSELDYIEDYFEQINKATESSIIYKTLKKENEVSILEFPLNYVFTFKGDGSDLKLLSEYYNFKPLFNNVLKLKNGEVIEQEELSKISNSLKKSNVLSYFLPGATEYLIIKNNQDKTSLDEIDWKAEQDTTNIIMAKLLDLLIAFSPYVDKPVDFLGSDNFISTSTGLINELLKLQIVNNYGNLLLDKVKEYVRKNQNENIYKIVSKIELNENFQLDIENIIYVLKDLYLLGIFENKDLDIKKEGNLDLINNIATKIVNISFIKGNESDLIFSFIEETSFGKYITKEDLNKIDYSTEITNIIDVLKEYVKLANDLDPIKDYQEILLNSDLAIMVDKLVESEIITEIVIPLLNDKIKDFLIKEELNEISEVINIQSTNKEMLATDIKSLIRIYDIYKKISIENKIDFSDENLNIELIEKMFALSFIQNNEGKLLNTIIKFAGIQETLDNVGIIIETNNINWDNESINLGKLLAKISQIDGNDISQLLTNVNEEEKQKLIDLLKNIVCLQTLQKSFPNVIEKFIDDANLSDWKSSWLIEQKEVFIEEQWLLEVDNIVDVMVYLNNNSCDFNVINDENVEIIKILLLKMNNVKSLSLDHVVVLLNDVVKDLTGLNSNYLTVSDSTNWDVEIERIFGSDGIYLEMKNLSSASNYATYGRVLDKVKNSSLIGNKFYNLVSDYIKTFDAYKTDGILTDDDISVENLSQISSFEEEFALIDRIDLSNTSNPEVIGLIMQSKILRRVAKKYIWDIIVDNSLDEYYTESEFNNDIIEVDNKVAGGTYSWELETQNILEFATAFTTMIENLALGIMPTEAIAQNVCSAGYSSVIATTILNNFRDTNSVVDNYFTSLGYDKSH